MLGGATAASAAAAIAVAVGILLTPGGLGVNLLDPNLGPVGTAILYLDWLAHSVVTVRFVWCVAAAAALAVLVYLSATGAIDAFEARVSERCPWARPLLKPFSKSEQRRAILAEGERLYKEATEILNAPGQSGREPEALGLLMKAASCGMEHAQSSDLFLRSIHDASDLCRLLGKSEKALKLKQVEKFYCESVVVRHVDPALKEQLDRWVPPAGGGGDAAADDTKDGLGDQRCKTFTRLARMFLAQNDTVMAMDYALKAFALREKLEGAKLRQHAVPGLAGLKEALSDALATTEEQTVLRECFMASAAPLK